VFLSQKRREPHSDKELVALDRVVISKREHCHCARAVWKGDARHDAQVSYEVRNAAEYF